LFICLLDLVSSILFSLRVNTPLLAALVWEISFVEIPRGLPRGVSFDFLYKLLNTSFFWGGGILAVQNIQDTPSIFWLGFTT
jgi:hypothetical protein